MNDKPILSMTAQQALNELCHYFLGDDWFEPTGQTHPEVVNFRIVEEIKKRYRGVKIKKNKILIFSMRRRSNERQTDHN